LRDIGGEQLECARLPLVIDEFRLGHRLVRDHVFNPDQVLRLGERQRLEQDAVDDGKNRDAGADTDGERGQHGQRKTGGATHAAPRKTQVLKYRGKHAVLLAKMA
jgi:hypothetical protein